MKRRSVWDDTDISSNGFDGFSEDGWNDDSATDDWDLPVDTRKRKGRRGAGISLGKGIDFSAFSFNGLDLIKFIVTIVLIVVVYIVTVKIVGIDGGGFHGLHAWFESIVKKIMRWVLLSALLCGITIFGMGRGSGIGTALLVYFFSSVLILICMLFPSLVVILAIISIIIFIVGLVAR